VRETMHIFYWIFGGLVYTFVVFAAGRRYGNTLSDEAHQELDQLRARLGSKVAGKTNPYRKIS